MNNNFDSPGCLSTNALTINILADPTAELSYQEEICIDDTTLPDEAFEVTAMVNNAELSNFEWTFNGIIVDSVTSNTLNFANAELLPDNEYTISVSITEMDGNGCSGIYEGSILVDVCSNLNNITNSPTTLQAWATNNGIYLQGQAPAAEVVRLSLYN